MSTDESVVEHTYDVVMNLEGQYSIWRTNQNIPLGWVKVGKTGSREECLAYIKEVWTDMRPLSLRQKMQQRFES